MNQERWKQIDDIFQAALALAPAHRAAYLEKACAGDAELLHHIEKLIDQYEKADDAIETPANRPSAAGEPSQTINDERDPLLGTQIGAYLIEREIGRGGMGAVYLATRADKAFQRRVAIKIIKRGMDTDYILRRFRHERRILAALDHPNIARLLDGGATASGQPYFVMEYIEGESLYPYCDKRRLGVRARLRLFCEICTAVEYAHQNHIIHRDIKPSNVLVTRAETAKLFDFGIAKLLNPEPALETAPITATAMQMMTLEYASPEQVQGLYVTYLSDVYSLGVMLYELLTGHRPYRFRNRLLHEMARVILEEVPELPSAALTRTDNIVAIDENQKPTTVEQVCELRDDTLDGLRRQLAGDLDHIVIKALRKEAGERYQSAAALREDILRYLDGRPVSAPVTHPNDEAGKTLAIASLPTPPANSIAVLPLKLLLINSADDTDERFLGVGLTDALITRLSKVRSLIVRPTSSVLRYNDTEVDPFSAGRELGVEYILDGNIRRVGGRIRVTVQLLNVADLSTNWAQSFDEKLTDVLELEDSISEKVANSLVPQLTNDEQQQLAKRGTNSPEAHEAYLRGRYHWYLLTEESFAKAIVYYNQAIALDPSYAAVHAAIAEYYGWLAIFGVRPPAECLTAARDAGGRAVRLDAGLAEAHAALGFALLAQPSQWRLAKTHYQRAIELNPNYALARVWYADQLTMEGRFAEADVEMRRARELDPLNSFNAYLREWDLYQARRYEESIRQANELIASDPGYGQAYFCLSWTLRRVGKYEEAIHAAQKALAIDGSLPLHTATLGLAYAEAGETDAARCVLSELNELAAKRYTPAYHRALIHLYLDDVDAALCLLEQSVDEGDPWIVWLGVEPQFDRLRHHPRFLALLQRTNNPAALVEDEGVKG